MSKILIGNKSYRLHFDFAALDKLKEEFGVEFETEVSRAAIETDLKALCKVVEIGLSKEHDGELSADEIYNLDTPLIQMNESIRKALNKAYTGEEEPAIQNPTIMNRIKLAWRILFSKADSMPIV